MHEGKDGSSKFVFDLMEPERPKVDRAVLDFVKATVFDPADFTIRTDGVVRLTRSTGVKHAITHLSFEGTAGARHGYEELPRERAPAPRARCRSG